MEEEMALSKDSDIRIVLLGKTGSGKSSTGNTILGRNDLRVEYSFQSTTKRSERVSIDVGERRISVIDTPDLFDTARFADERKAHLEKVLELAAPGPNVFLLVFRLDMKFTEEEKNAVLLIEKNFGEQIRRHIIVLFTHGYELERRGRTIEQYVEEEPELRNVVARMAEYHVFENSNNDRVQVTELLEKIECVRRRNFNRFYTREMYDRAQRELLKKISMTLAGVAGGVVGAAGGGAAAAALTTAVGLAKEWLVLAGAATGAAALAGIAVGAAAAEFYLTDNSKSEEKKKH